MRRTHLRGHINILKRMLVQVGDFNLGLVMRKLIGVGKPRRLQGLFSSVVAPNETIICYREHYERNRSIADNARMIVAASGQEQYRRNYIDPCAYNLQPGMSETIARQYELAGVTPLSGWPRVNVMGEHAMVQKVKYRLENGTDISRLIQVFKTCTNLRREFRSWKYKTDKDGRPLAADAFDDTGRVTCWIVSRALSPRTRRITRCRSR